MPEIMENQLEKTIVKWRPEVKIGLSGLKFPEISGYHLGVPIIRALLPERKREQK